MATSTETGGSARKITVKGIVANVVGFFLMAVAFYNFTVVGYSIISFVFGLLAAGLAIPRSRKSMEDYMGIELSRYVTWFVVIFLIFLAGTFA